MLRNTVHQPEPAVFVARIFLFSLLHTKYVAKIHTVEQSSVTPQNACAPGQVCGKIAPPPDAPIQIPIAPQNILISNLVPIVAKSVVIEATAAPCRLTKAPEQKP